MIVNPSSESPEGFDDQVGGRFYGYLTCQAEAEPPPIFRCLDAENIPVSSGKMLMKITR